VKLPVPDLASSWSSVDLIFLR
jgi:hypothetical protein